MCVTKFIVEGVPVSYSCTGQTLQGEGRGGESGQIPIIILFLTHQEFLGLLANWVSDERRNALPFLACCLESEAFLMENFPNAYQFMFTPISLAGLLLSMCNTKA